MIDFRRFIYFMEILIQHFLNIENWSESLIAYPDGFLKQNWFDVGAHALGSKPRPRFVAKSLQIFSPPIILQAYRFGKKDV